jgi:hypothetical protein
LNHKTHKHHKHKINTQDTVERDTFFLTKISIKIFCIKKMKNKLENQKRKGQDLKKKMKKEKS